MNTLKLVLFFMLFLSSPFIFAQQIDGFKLFKKVRFEPAYANAYKSKLFVPNFDMEIRSYHGKEIYLTGYVIQHEVGIGEMILLSSKPFAQCFFCGGAGPETIAEVYLKGGRKNFPQDKILTVKGKLYLNENDPSHLFFWLKEAVIVP